jgi:hypothetical protein
MKQSCNGRFDEKLYKERTKSERVGDQKGKKRKWHARRAEVGSRKRRSKGVIAMGNKGVIANRRRKNLGGGGEEK